MAQPTSPSHRFATGPSLSPRKRAERGKARWIAAFAATTDNRPRVRGLFWTMPSREAGAAHARCLGGGRHLLDQVIDGRLDRTQERERVDPHPHDQDQQWNEQRLLACAQVEHAAKV